MARDNRPPAGDPGEFDPTIDGNRNAPPPPPPARRVPPAGGTGQVPPPSIDRTRPGTRPVPVPGVPPPATRRMAPPRALEPSGFDRYRIGEELGRGGLGVVQVALDSSLNREVAIKSILRPDNRRAVEAFVEEAQITGQLEHPNIVPVHELGTDPQGRPYLAMKRVAGKTLREVIRESFDRRRKDPSCAGREEQQLIDVFLRVCDAIRYAHSRGVLHRDLKPDNVMVGEFGEVLVMDWGLARPIGFEGDDEEPAARPVVSDRRADSTDVTRDGAVVGTPAWMPPEQAAGRIRDLDERADIYSLGAILYMIATGRAPFSGDSSTHIQQILADVVAGRFDRPGAAAGSRGRVSHELDAIVMKAMARKPAARYRDVAALQSDLAAWRAWQPITARRASLPERVVRWTRRHPKTTLATSLLTVAGLVVAVLLFQLQATDQAKRLAEAERERADARSARALAEADANQQRARLAEAASAAASGELEKAQALLIGEARSAQEATIRRFMAQWEGKKRRGVELDTFINSMSQAELSTYYAAFDYYISTAAETGAKLTSVDWFWRAMLRQNSLHDLSGAIDDYTQAIRLDSEDGVLYLNRGNARSSIGDFPGARDDLLRATQLLPNNANPIEGLAVAYARGGNLPEAERVARQALQVSNGLASSHTILGGILLQQGKTIEALEHLDQALDTAPSASAFSHRAIANERLGRTENQLSDMDQAIRLSPDNAALYYNRGLMLRRAGRNSDAIADLNRSIELEPSHGALLTRANIKAEQGDNTGAMADYNQAISMTDSAAARYSRASLYADIGELAPAVADCQRAVELAPDDPSAWYSLGNMHRLAGDPQAAIHDYSRALELDPAMEIAYGNRALAKVKLRDFNGAVIDYTRAIALAPERAQNYCNRGNAKTDIGDYRAALDDFQLAIDRDPDYANAYFSRAVTHERLKDVPAILANLAQVLRIHPEDARVLEWRSKLLLDCEEYEPALEHLEVLVRLRPGINTYHFRLALCRSKTGDIEGAIRDYTISIQIKPLWQAYANRSMCLEDVGKKDDAVADLKLAIGLCDNSKIREDLERRLQAMSQPSGHGD